MSDTHTATAAGTTTTTTADDALIDDIAAEYPDLAGGGEELRQHHADEDSEMIPPGSAQEIDHTDLALDEDNTQIQHHDHEMDVGVDELAGDVDGEEEGGLTDEALRQFANAAAIHYDLNHHEHHEHQVDLQDEHHHHNDGQEDTTQEHTSRHGEETEQLDPSLAQVVTGSIPPPPRPTYHQHQHTHSDSNSQTVADTAMSTTTGEKRKRDEYDPASLDSVSIGGAEGGAPGHPQPIQAQADPLQHPLIPLQHRHMILPRTPGIHQAEQQGGEKSSSLETGASLPLGSMYPHSRGSHPSAPSIQPQQDPAQTQQAASTRARKPTGAASSTSATTAGGGGGPASGRGRVRSQGVVLPGSAAGEEMQLTDGGGAGEGSDGGAGRKEGKDERSARRAEQNRRAQQNFRKRREEAMKEQAARLEVLIPQMEEMKRQQAETQLLLEALKLENTALRAVLVQAVKKGARILDETGELIGASSMPLPGVVGVGNSFPHGHPHPQTHARGPSADGTGQVDVPDVDAHATEETSALQVEGEEEEGETGIGLKAVQDVYAALDRLGARTHVYARTIVPLVTADEQQPQQPQPQQQEGQQQVAAGYGGTHSSSHHLPTNLPTLGPIGGSSRRQAQAKRTHSHQPIIAQSSIRTVQHPQHPPQQGSPYTPSSYGLNNMQNLPPFPGSGSVSGLSQNGRSNSFNVNPPGSAGSAVSEQMRAVEEAIAEIDPALQVASVASGVPETHHAVGSGNQVEAEGQDGMMVDPSIDVSLS